MKLENLHKISGVLGGSIALISLLVTAFFPNNPGFQNSRYILLILGGLLIIIWMGWVTQAIKSVKDSEDRILNRLDSDTETGFVYVGKREEERTILRDRSNKEKGVYREVRFNKEFESIPLVYASLSLIDAYEGTTIRISAEVRDVETWGFRIYVSTWEGSMIYGATVQWLATGLRS